MLSPRQLLRHWGVLPLRRHRQDLVIDVGSINTRILIKDRLVSFPTMIALSEDQTVVGVGQAAASIVGKTPAQITVESPVQTGRVTSVEALRLFFVSLAHSELHLPLWSSLLRKVILAVPPGTPPVQRQLWRKAAQSLAGRVLLRDSVDATWKSLHNQRIIANQSCFMNIGGMTTIVAFHSQGQVIVKKLLPIGGYHFTWAVQQAIRQNYHCEVGWQTAEKIKQTIGTLSIEASDQKVMAVRGRDVVSGLPTTCQVQNQIFQTAFLELFRQISESFQQLCQQCPAEMLAPILDRGVLCTGGGSLLPGLKDALAAQLRLPVNSSPLPLEDVVRGLALLERHEK